MNNNELKVTVRQNGPYMFEGKIKISNSSGEIIKEAEKVLLCRCGQSKNKPFCDATHKISNFQAE